MKCAASLEELSAYVDGELDGTRAAAIEQHLRGCDACRAQAASLRQFSGLLSETASLVDPSVRLRAGLARRLAMTEERPRFTCSRMQVAMSEMLDGELAGEDAHLLKEHLDRCPACASEYASLDNLSLSLQSLPMVEPPLGLERAIRAAIAREQQGLFRLPSLGQLLRPRLAPGLATAMAGATLALGFWLGRSVPTAPAPQVATPVYTGQPVATQPVRKQSVTHVPQAVAERPARASTARPSQRPALAATAVAVAEPAVKPATIRRKSGPAAAVKAGLTPQPASLEPATTVAAAPPAPAEPPVVEIPTPAPAEEAPAVSTPAPAPLPTAVVAEAPQLEPATLSLEGVGQVLPLPAQTRTKRLANQSKRSWQEEVEAATALLVGRPPRKHVGATIATLHFD
ncbi:MAG: hypothetical protein GX774_10935 [Armatimonadetes bacterium]|jgi:anti-sigma factor RsiW|nr:hypothetical protein [Armatimonadota bacterium]